jgi:molybdopterin-guanine dinucleotide biosynthesis protein B
VLIEGYKREPHPKLEVHRAGIGTLMQPDDPAIVAIASDRPVPGATVPVMDLNDIEAVVEAMLAYALPVDQALAQRSG